MILIVAPNASSQYGGEAFLPLKYFQILHRRGYPVKLIAHVRNREDLIDFLGAAVSDVYFIEDTLWHRVIWAIGRRLPRRLRDLTAEPILNRISEHYQARVIQDWAASGAITLIHQPTPVSPRAASSIYGFGVPVIIGPMNGAMTLPEGYRDLEGLATRALIAVGSRIAPVVNRWLPGKRRAAALLVANARTRAALPCPDHPRIVTLVENGVDFDVWSQPPETAGTRGTGPFRLIFMGRLVDWKAVDITLAALAKARAAGVEAELEILGDGPERDALEQQARDLGLAAAVTFSGFQPQAECARRLADADALILNSVWECGGAVVLEAMAMGLPVIASDWGGPADYLDASCGILVSPVPRASFADRLAAAIGTLTADPALRARMGAAAEAKVRQEYDWEKKVDRMIEIYDEITAGAGGVAPRGGL